MAAEKRKKMRKMDRWNSKISDYIALQKKVYSLLQK